MKFANLITKNGATKIMDNKYLSQLRNFFIGLGGMWSLSANAITAPVSKPIPGAESASSFFEVLDALLANSGNAAIAIMAVSGLVVGGFGFVWTLVGIFRGKNEGGDLFIWGVIVMVALAAIFYLVGEVQKITG